MSRRGEPGQPGLPGEEGVGGGGHGGQGGRGGQGGSVFGHERFWYGLWFGLAYLLVCALFIVTITEHNGRRSEHVKLCQDLVQIEREIIRAEKIEFGHDKIPYHVQTIVPVCGR